MKNLFETKDLKIRKFEEEDAAQLYMNHLEKEVKQYIPNECYADMKETKDAIQFYRDCVENQRFPFVLAVELKETGELIGDVGLCLVVNCSNEVEIGYTICRKYSRNGYATQLVQGMTKFAYDTFGIQVLYGRVLHGNKASIRVLEKNGYSFLLEEKDAEDDPYGKGILIYKKTVLSD